MFSYFPDEDDILLEPETTFRVVSIQNDMKEPKIKRIVVEVQSTPLVIKETVENFTKTEFNFQHSQQQQQQMNYEDDIKQSFSQPQLNNKKMIETSCINNKTGENKVNPPDKSKFGSFFKDFKWKPSVLDIFQHVPSDFYETLDESFYSASFENLNDIRIRSKIKVDDLEKAGTLGQLGVSKEEAEILLSYTYESNNCQMTPFSTVNKFLQEHDYNGFMPYHGYILHLLKALRKLKPIPSAKTTLYRSIDGESLKFDDDNYKVGNILTWPGFVPASPNEDIVYMLAKRLSNPVIFEIRGNFVGYNINEFSFNLDEDEVILEPETTFKVVSIQDDAKEPGVKRIVTEVLPTPLVIKDTIENFAKAERDFYHLQVSGSKSKKERLPPGWKKVTSPKGETFYFNTKTEETKIDPPEMTMSDMPFSDFFGESSALEIFQRMRYDFYESLEKAFESASFKNFDSIKKKSQEKVDKLAETGTLSQLGMSREEAEVLFSYTYEANECEKAPCYVMNTVLAERDTNGLRAHRGYILHLLKALRKLKPIKSSGTTLYRGIDGELLSFDDHHYKVGNTLTWPAFTSTALNEAVAYEFSSRKSQPVIFEIRGDFVGYNIKPFSNFPGEDEILLEPETTFKIVSIQKDTRNPKAKRIVLEVQPSPLMIKEAVENFKITEWNLQHPEQKRPYNINNNYVQQHQQMNGYQNLNQSQQQYHFQYQQNSFISQSLNLNKSGGYKMTNSSGSFVGTNI